MGSTTSGHTAPHTTPQAPLADFPTRIKALRVQHRDNHYPAGLPFCVPSSLHTGGTGILTCCPSPTLLSLGLGPTNPTRIDLPSETLDIRRTWFLHVFATHAGIRTSAGRKLSSRSALYLLQNAPLPHVLKVRIRSFGV
jgi:hypothetical protein